MKIGQKVSYKNAEYVVARVYKDNSTCVLVEEDYFEMFNVIGLDVNRNGLKSVYTPDVSVITTAEGNIVGHLRVELSDVTPIEGKIVTFNREAYTETLL